MIVLDIIKKIDIYGQALNFTTFGNTYHKTWLGGFTTICFLASMFLWISSNAVDFLYHKNPNYIYKQVTLDNYPLYNINNRNFIILIRIEDENSSIVDYTKYLKISAKYLQSGVNGIFNSTNLNFMNCTNTNKTIQYMNSSVDLESGASCISFDNISLGGNWDVNFTNFIRINVDICRDNKECYNESEIESFLTKNDYYITIYTPEQNINLTDYFDPLKSHMFSTYNMIDFRTYKKRYLYYKQSNVSTDTGMIWQNITNDTIFSIESSFYDTKFIGNNRNKSLIQMEIFFTQNVDLYEIKFKKLQDFFTDFSGIVIFFYSVFELITIRFNKHDKTMKLVNKLFDFSKFEDEKTLEKIIEIFNNKNENENDFRKKFSNNNSKDMSVREKFRNQSDLNIEISAEIQEKPKKRDLYNAEKIKGLYKDRKSSYILVISILKVLKAFLCRAYLSKRDDFFIKIYEKSKKIIIDKLDVVNYLKFYQEYSVMKTIIFNDITNLCLTLPKKPNLYENNSFSQIHLSKDERIKKVFDYFSLKDFYNSNDRKLLDVISQDVRKIIKLYKENSNLV